MTLHCRRLHVAAAVAMLSAVLAADAPQRGPSAVPGRQQQDEDFARQVRAWTTRPEFLSPLVDHLPRVPGVPSPKDVLGHHVGAPKVLTYYADAVAYYRALAARTGRVKVMTIGTTDEGRECVVVAIGSEESIRDLDQYRAYLAQLADPRNLTDAQAADIVARAKPIYHLMGGLHSGETGPPEMLMELAYRLAVEDSPVIARIRDNVIVTITPVAEPDGRDRYVDWYYAYKIDETGENDNVGGPPYWGKYVFHDNNRDINYSQVSMRAVLDWYLKWHPPIVHDLHESVPFLYTFSGQAPQNPTLDPILFGEMPWFANFEMAQMTKYGMPGVWTHAFVDMWSPGYFGSMASNHNGMLRMYETFGNGGANTMKRRVDRGEGGAGGGQTSREWYRPLPPYKDVEWSLRNNTNYMETAVLSALELTAAFPRDVLDNFYRKSLNAIAAGRNEAPYGYVIPAGQADPTRVAFVVNTLRTQGIEVGRARAAFELKEGRFPAGSFVVKRDQPYGRLAKILLEKQNFPDPGLRTYDDSGWTMGLMTQTDVKESGDRAILDVAVDPVTDVGPVGKLSGTGPAQVVAVAHDGSAGMVTLRWRLRNLAVRAAERAFDAPGGSANRQYPAGSFLIRVPDPTALAEVRTAIETLGLDGVVLRAAPDVPSHELDLPRIAIYSTWGSTQTVGWVRYTFDRYAVPYDLIYKERVKQGGLRSAYHVIVVPDQGGSAKRIVFDIEPKSRPLAYRKSERFRNLGMYGESDDITGGMGLAGVEEFARFVADGGVLMTLGSATFFPADFGLARRVDAARPSSAFYAPGPIVEAQIVRADHPIFYGYGGAAPKGSTTAAPRPQGSNGGATTGTSSVTVPVRWANGPLLRVPDEDRSQVLMQFPGGDNSVLSGLMKGASEIRNRPAIVDVPSGKGRVLLYSTNPCYRWQNLGEFNMLFNALLNYNDLPASTR